jgi:hypothetical protein
MNPVFAALIPPPEFGSQTSAHVFSVVAITLSAILLVTVVLILFRHDSGVTPFKSQSRNDSFDHGEKK